MKRKKNDSNFIRIMLTIAAVLFVSYMLVRFVASKTVVEGVSMFPTLENGEQVLIDKLTYTREDPKRFDIVVFKTPVSGTGYYIKRVIGLPGEEVAIDKNGVIYINGMALNDKYGYGVITNPGLALKTVKVEKGEYFVLGDNRNYSTDSRFKDVGNIKMEDIEGRVAIRIWPLDKFGYIDLYRERTD